MPDRAEKDVASKVENEPRRTREEHEKQITERFNAIKRNDFAYLDKQMGPVGWLPSRKR